MFAKKIKSSKQSFKLSLLTLSLLFAVGYGQRAYGSDDLSVPDQIKLASRLISDGRLDKAGGVLNLVEKVIEMKDHHESRYDYRMVRGVFYLQSLKFSEADTQISMAYELASTKDEKNDVLLYLAQAKFGNEDYAGVSRIFEDSSLTDLKIRSTKHPNLYTILTKSYLETKNILRALVLTDLVDNADEAIVFQKIEVYFSAGLHKKAYENALSFVSQSRTSSKDMLAIAAKVYRYQGIERLIEYLEVCLLLKPDDTTISHKLALSYIRSENYVAAESLLREVFVKKGDYAFELSELNLALGNLAQSSYYNIHVKDPLKKLKQKIAIFLASESYSEIASLHNEAKRYDLLKDQDFKYVMGYALMKSGSFDDSAVLISSITKPHLLPKALELRKTLKTCNQSQWQCIN